MRQLLGRAVLIGSVVVLGAAACSDDETPGPAAPGSDAGQSNGDGGTPSAGGEPSAGSSQNGGKAGMTTGGTAGAEGGGTHTEGGVDTGGSLGGSDEPGTGGVGGEGGGASEPEPGPPDLITLTTKSPWPDSFTGECANAKKSIVCPQVGDAFFGQDGTYRINVPTYKTTSTTLTDSVTGLTWQLSPPNQTRTQPDAVAYCEALELDGQSDWRLPTRLEYVSLLDEGAPNGSCMPPSVPRDGIGNSWTASPTATAAGQFFVINEQYGAWNVGVDSSSFVTRCVRGPALTGTRQAETDVVTDTTTGLVWQTTSLDDTFVTWEDALAYCEALTHAGKDDWRLPSIKELASAVDESLAQPPVLYAELGGTAAQYWSSTPAPSTGGSERFAFALETSFGISPSFKSSDVAAAARCVRSVD